MVNPKKNKTKKPLVITPCDIDCRKEEDEANFPNDKKIICFLCRKWSHHHCTGEEAHCLTYIYGHVATVGVSRKILLISIQ